MRITSFFMLLTLQPPATGEPGGRGRNMGGADRFRYERRNRRPTTQDTSGGAAQGERDAAP